MLASGRGASIERGLCYFVVAMQALVWEYEGGSAFDQPNPVLLLHLSRV